MSSILEDVRHGIRVLVKAPGFTAIAVLTLALGIGANTAIFSVINSILLEPLPFKNPSQLVSLRETESAPGNFPLDGADYLDWQAQNKTFTSMSLFSYPQGMNASGAGQPESAAVIHAQANFLDTLGVEPLIGRGFAKGEDVAGKNHVVVLSYGFWQRHFGGQRRALGKTLQLNDETYTVIGVMPQWFNYPPETDIWTPFDMNSRLVHNRGSHWAGAIGRVKNGVTIGQARADLRTISERINKEYRQPDDQAIHSLVFPLQDYLVRSSRAQLWILFGAVGLVLLVACANVANLLLARSTGRVREMAVRAALGAGRGRLARQLLTESVLLALAGAALGTLVAWWCVGLLVNMKSLPIPRMIPVDIDLRVLGFTILVTLMVGILFGISPALQTSQIDLNEELKASANAVVSPSAGGKLLRDALVAGEIAVSLALLVGAGLLLRSFAEMRSANIGVDPVDVLTMRINLPTSKYSTAAARETYCKKVLERLERIPVVAHAAISDAIALDGRANGYVTVPGNTNPKLANQLVEQNAVSPEYFRAFGIPLMQGRTFTAADGQRVAEVAPQIDALYKAAKNPGEVKIPARLFLPVVINERMARLFWPEANPIGKGYASGGVQCVVIGVVGDEKQGQIRRPAGPENYFPLEFDLYQGGFAGTISVKTKIAPMGAVGEVRRAIAGVDNSIALYQVRTMQQVIAENMQGTRVQTFLLSVFAALALVLAVVGIYGVMAYLVTQRTHEIGIRMALGAQRADVMRLVLGQGTRLTLIGVAMGIAAALALTRLMASLLFGVSSTDPVTFFAVAILLTMVALAACWIPARRATKIDPMVALRYE